MADENRADHHIVLFVCVSEEAKDALLDSRMGEEALPHMVLAQADHMPSRFPDGHIPDINGIFPFKHIVDGAVVAVLCKPRSFRQSDNTLGWGIVVVSEKELDQLIAMEPGQRDGFVSTVTNMGQKEGAMWLAQF